MPVSSIALVAVLLASALAAGVSALASRRQKMLEFAPWWGALAVGLAYVIGHAGVATPSIPPGDVHDRIPLIALAGAAVAALLSGRRGVLWARIVGAITLATLAYLTIMGPVLGAGEIARELVLPYAMTAVVALLAMTNVALLDHPSHRSELWLALTVLAAQTGVVLLLVAHSAVLFFLAGTLAVVLAASLLGAWGRPIGGGIPVASAVLTALLIDGTVYAALPPFSALLLAAAPALLWLNRLPPIKSLGPIARSAIAVGLMLIPVGIAIVWIVRTATDSSGY